MSVIANPAFALCRSLPGFALSLLCVPALPAGAAPGNDIREPEAPSVRRSAGAMPRVPSARLACALEAAPQARNATVRLTHQGGAAIAQGAKFSWALAGLTPPSLPEMRALPAPLSAGQSFVFVSAQSPAGATGCTARLER